MTRLGLAGWESLLDLSLHEILSALLIGSAMAVVLGGCFALARKRIADAPPVVGLMVLVASALAMALTLGFIKEREQNPSLPSAGERALFAGQPAPAPAPPGAPSHGPMPGFPPRPHWLAPGSFLSAQIMRLADANGDGRLSHEEARQTLETLLSEAAGSEQDSMSQGDLEAAINRQLFPAHARRGDGGPGRGPDNGRAHAARLRQSSESSSRSG